MHCLTKHQNRQFNPIKVYLNRGKIESFPHVLCSRIFLIGRLITDKVLNAMILATQIGHKILLKAVPMSVWVKVGEMRAVPWVSVAE